LNVTDALPNDAVDELLGRAGLPEPEPSADFWLRVASVATKGRPAVTSTGETSHPHRRSGASRAPVSRLRQILASARAGVEAYPATAVAACAAFAWVVLYAVASLSPGFLAWLGQQVSQGGL
jgi:hypothetical protein